MRGNVLEDIRERAAARPDATAWVADGAGKTETVRASYREMLARVDQHAEALRSAGFGEGQRIGLVAPQGPGFIEWALGILAAEACLVPIPDDTVGPALDAFAERSMLHGLVVLPKGGEAEISQHAAASQWAAAEEARFQALSPAYLRFTSGTTHRRKGVILGHTRILERLEAANRGLAIGPEDRVLWLLPMAHHFVVSILLYLRNGATILLPATSMARDILAFASGEGATVCYASPYHYNLLSKDGGEDSLPKVRLAVSTAEGLREEIASRFAARFGKPLCQALGIIEVGLPVIDLEDPQPGALGRPLPDYEVWLRRDDGSRLADGASSADATGEICIRGPGLFDAYLDPWTPSAEILEPDGFRTGDQGWYDESGRLHMAGRRANRINMAGMKFFSEEVEAVLDQLPQVKRSRVFAKQHPHLGEIPAAEFELQAGAEAPDRKTLMTHCRAQLASYKIPRSFDVVEALPLTATGKLERAPEFEGER